VEQVVVDLEQIQVAMFMLVAVEQVVDLY